MNVRKLLLCAAGFVALSAASASVANATAIVTYTPGSSVSSLSGYTLLQNFDSYTSGGNVQYLTGTDGGFLTGTYSGTQPAGDYAICKGLVYNTPGALCAPPDSTDSNSGTATPYLAIFGGKTVTYDLTQGGTSAGWYSVAFDWGTLNYNGTPSTDDMVTATFSNGTTMTLDSATYSQYQNQNGLGMATITGGNLLITGLTFHAGQNSFEIDNIEAQPAAVPEPWTLALFGVGLGGAAMVRLRKKAKTA